MPANRKSGGSWVSFTTANRRSGGSWTTVGFIKKRSGGTWVQVWPRVAISAQTTAASAGTIVAGTSHYRLNSSGAVETNTGNGTVFNTVETWLQAGTNTEYEARATVISDPNATLVGTFGSWVALSSTQTWDNNNLGSGAGTSTASMTIEIRDASTTTVLDTAIIDFSSEFI